MQTNCNARMKFPFFLPAMRLVKTVNCNALLHLFGCFILGLYYTNSFAQGEANNWYFGTQAGITFNTNPPTALTNGQLSTGEGCAAISDANGNLLFYTDGITVRNRNHAVMLNGTGLLGDPSSAQSAIIIPKPGSTTNYYIITVPATGANGMRFSEVDMTLGGGLGAVLASNKNTLMFTPSSEKVTAVKHANDLYYWVIGRGNGTNKNYVAFLIDCNGVNTTPVTSNVGITNGENWGYLVASPDGSKLASASSGSGVEITDFNTSTGVVSNTVWLGSLDYAGATGGNYGVAFSPNGNLLYATSIHSWALAQWDLTAANIPATRMLIGYTNGGGAARPSYRGGALQLAPDGKIYIAEGGISSLGVINNPNALGASCNYVASQLGLAGRVCRLGLPPFIQSYFNTAAQITHNAYCSGQTATFTISGNTANLDSVKWNFDDAASGANNFSAQLSPSHIFNSAGTYNVLLVRYLDCVADSIYVTVNLVQPTAVQNATICYNETYTLPGGGTTNIAGTYYDTLQNSLGCDSIITTNLTVVANTLSATGDTAICLGASTMLSATGGGLEYSWSPTTGLSDANIANPIASPVVTTQYVVRSLLTGNNLIVNGDFEQGNTGFTSGYIYSTPNPLGGPGYYTVSTAVSNGWWPGCTDHTPSGSGNMFIGDGANNSSGVVSAGSSVWCQTVSVSPNTDYAFSTWLTNINSSGSTSQLRFMINGSQIGAIQNTPLGVCQWNQFYVIWNSGANTTANVCIEEASGAQPGNDFALDDISFVPTCEAYDTVTVIVHQPLYTTQNPVICDNATFVRPNGSVINTAGSYIDTLPQINGCDSIITTNLTVNPTYQVTENPVICANETYARPNGIMVNISGTYIDTLQAVNSCDSVITTNLTVNPIYTITQNPVICANETYTRPNGTVVNTSGVYTDTLQTINSCDSVIITNLTVNPIYFISQNPIICANETYTRPNGTVVTTAGTYVDTLQTINGCDSVITTNLTVNPIFQTTQNPVICANEIFMRPSGIAANITGTYIDTLQAVNSCDSIITTNLTVNPTYLTTILDTICAYQSYTLPLGNVVNTSGTYIDSLQTVNGCDSIISTNLTVIDIVLSHTSVNIRCNGENSGSITINNTDGLLPLQYVWSNGGFGNPIANIPAGNYTVTVTDAFGCTATSNTVISQPSPLSMQTSFTEPLCYGEANGTVSVTAQGGVLPYRYLLNNLSSDSGTFSSLVAGTYTAVVRDSNNCSAQSNVFVTQPDAFELYHEPTVLGTDLGNPLQIVVSSNYNNTSFVWQPPSGLSCTNCPNPVFNLNYTSEYVVTATVNPHGKDCIYEYPLTVIVYPKRDFYIPNAFTPNGDGSNDFFSIFLNESSVRQVFVKVFNRWGEMVFEANSPNFAWDGKYRGQYVSPGIYVYELRIVYTDNVSQNTSGSITVLR